MDYIIERASALTAERLQQLGITGIPADWPIEMYPYTGTVPDGFEQISDTDLTLLKANNQAAYDAWLQTLRPIQPATPSTQEVVVTASPAFSSKSFGTKKLFKRVIGIQSQLTQGVNTILYTITFPWAKITGLEVIGSESLDTASFYVLDSVTGAISGVPNYTLNQFGFAVNLAKDYYEHKSEFDADLYAGLQVKIVYTSLTAKAVGINLILNEVK